MNKHLHFLLLAFFVLLTVNAKSQGFLKAHGTAIVDEQGHEVILRGMGLGGWMLQEGYMLQISNKGMQHLIKARITDLIGQENCDKFYDQWLQNHMTRADVDSLAKWGFNSIRLPMHYNLFTLPIEEEPVAGQQTWLNKGFELTDSLLSWCKANGLYLILDLHAAPGGQGKDANISDYDETKPSLWESEQNKEKTVALWRKLAERYANEPFIGGYDLINEPNWTFESKNRNGLEDTLNQPIWDLYQRITQAIRDVDKKHIIIIEGNGWGNNYRGFKGPWDNNMALSFHKYWSPNIQATLDGITGLRTKFNMPVWLGESGENSNKWFTDCISLVEQNRIGWAWWPLKKINSVVCPLMIVAPPEYKQLTDHWNKNTAKPSRELATRVLFEIVQNLRAENCRYNKDVIDAMFRQRMESSTLPFAHHIVPGRIFATDYDMGQAGIAYADNDNENTGEEGKKAGNKGREYRNEGVDITVSNDQKPFTNGYCLVDIEDGEWLLYTVDVADEGTYNVTARVSAAKSDSRIGMRVLNSPDTKNLQAVTLISTASEEEWKTVSLGMIELDKGRHTLQVIAEKGGFRLGFIELNH